MDEIIVGHRRGGGKIPYTQEQILECYQKHNGNVRRVALELGISRHSVRRSVKKAGLGKKPLKAGTKFGIVVKRQKLPAAGKIQRYILTSAQNNTKLNDRVWENLLALAKYYKATVLVGTYSYNQNHFGPLAVKRGKFKGYQKDLWYDERITPFISDERLQLANGLVWCGEMNILPTAVNPLEGLETYSARKSAIFPHAKMAMRSIAGPMGQSAKLNYTTGTVTKYNYIQKRAGLIAEFHHIYGGLLVEVDSKGHWWVRQLNALESNAEIRDLDLLIRGGKVTSGNTVEAITWGDIHATTIDPTVFRLSTKKGGMLDVLKPKFQFIHDLLEGASVNHHNARKPLERFRSTIRGLGYLKTELEKSAAVLRGYLRPWVKTVVVNSNHDRWCDRFLDTFDPKIDSPSNAEIYYAGNAQRYRELRGNPKGDPNVLEYLIREYGGLRETVLFLQIDDSFKICEKIECGWHGDLGPDGRMGTESNLSRIARLANIGNLHRAGIFSGLYVAGTSSTLKMSYNHGPTTWSHSHIVTYPNGKRTIITMYAGAWRAERR